MGLIERFFGMARAPDMAPLYAALVAEARQPEWYRDGGVPDTLDGRFDMVSLALSLVLLRLERDGTPGRLPSARLTEVFVRDMDGQLRETGFGDLVVGKQVGFAMAALGGRLGAYREGVSEAALVRNLWRGDAPDPVRLTATREMAEALRERIDATPFGGLMDGRIA